MSFDFLCFFFNDTATTEIYTLSLHDALPIYQRGGEKFGKVERISLDDRVIDVKKRMDTATNHPEAVFSHNVIGDRKSTRLNSSHGYISYAVFCLKKKNSTTLTSVMPHISLRR